MGRRQFDARAQSLPTHAIQSPLTRPFRSLGYDQAKRTATPKHLPRGYGNIEQGRASTAGRESKNKGRIAGTSHHALGEPTKPLRTRGAQARPWAWGSAPTTNEVAADEGHHTMPPGAPTTTLAQAREASERPRAWGSIPTTLAQQPTRWPQTRRHHAMPPGAPTTTLAQAREASERPRAWGSVPTTLAQQLMRRPQTRGHHAMPPGAPTATPTQRAVRGKLRNIREHGAQSPPTSLGASRHVRGTPTTTLALRLTSCAAHKRSFGTPMAMELSPLRKGLTPCPAKPMHQHVRVRMLCAAGLSGHND